MATDLTWGAVAFAGCVLVFPLAGDFFINVGTALVRHWGL